MHTVQAKSILSQSNGMNIYRGCSHGCIYCDSRSLCYQMNHVFEDIEVKSNAPELLDAALRSKRSKCMIGTGSMTDPYLHLEAQLGLTRRCLEVISRHGFGATVLTKSPMVLRDLDILEGIHSQTKAVVQMTLTTADSDLCRLLEPNVAVTEQRVEALQTFRDHGIPTVVWMTPILPFINDTEDNLRRLLRWCVDVGVRGILLFDFGVTLRAGSRDYFYSQLDRRFPGMRRAYEQTYGESYALTSPNAPTLWRIFEEECDRHKILTGQDAVFSYLHELPSSFEQQSFL